MGYLALAGVLAALIAALWGTVQRGRAVAVDTRLAQALTDLAAASSAADKLVLEKADLTARYEAVIAMLHGEVARLEKALAAHETPDSVRDALRGLLPPPDPKAGPGHA